MSVRSPPTPLRYRFTARAKSRRLKSFIRAPRTAARDGEPPGPALRLARLPRGPDRGVRGVGHAPPVRGDRGGAPRGPAGRGPVRREPHGEAPDRGAGGVRGGE